MLLVADDEPSLRHLLQVFLEGEGFEVETFANGREVIGRLEQGRRPEALILDVKMPVCTGLDVVHHVRARPGLADLPILLLTGGLDPLPPSVSETVHVVLPKPFDLDCLLAKICGMIANASADGGDPPACSPADGRMSGEGLWVDTLR